MLRIYRFHIFSAYHYAVQTISSSIILLPFYGCLALLLHLELYSTCFFAQVFLLCYAFDSRLSFSKRAWNSVVLYTVIAKMYKSFTLDCFQSFTRFSLIYIIYLYISRYKLVLYKYYYLYALIYKSKISSIRPCWISE